MTTRLTGLAGCVVFVAVAAALGNACGSDSDEGSGGTGAQDASSDGTGGTSAGTSGSGGSAGTSTGGSSTGGDAGASGADGSPEDAPPDDGGPIAEGIEKPNGIALSASDVYFASEGAGAILRCPKSGCGGSAPIAVVPGQTGQIGLAISGSTLFWRTEYGEAGTRALLTCTLPGCSSIDSMGLDLYGPDNQFGIAAHGGRVYVSVGPGIESCAVSGCGDAGSTNLMAPFSGPTAGIAVSATGVFFGRWFGGVAACPLSGCGNDASAGMLVPDAISSFAVAVDDANIYWSEYAFEGTGTNVAPTIRSCPAAGCDRASSNVLASGDIGPFGIAVDDTYLYYTDYVGDRVVRIRKPGN